MILEKYKDACAKPTDIHEHLPTLKKYAEECGTITEMGVRGIVSTWAFLAAKPKKMISYDIADPSQFGADIKEVYDAVEETEFEFKKANVLEIEIEPTDLLFIDTLHTREQLSEELIKHSDKVKKYIILHDTTTYAIRGEGGNSLGLWYAIKDFLDDNKDWVVKERFTNNNGLTILEKVI